MLKYNRHLKRIGRELKEDKNRGRNGERKGSIKVDDYNDDLAISKCLKGKLKRSVSKITVELGQHFHKKVGTKTKRKNHPNTVFIDLTHSHNRNKV